MSSSVSDYYDEYWSPDGYSPEGGLHSELAQVYERWLGKGNLVLDAGCGDGATSGPWLLAHGSYAGADISPSGLRVARSRGLDVTQVGDIATLPFQDSSFDAAVCVEVLEHLFDPAAAMREIRRVVKPGGPVIFTTPNIAYWRWRLDLLVHGRWNPLGDDRSVSEPWRDPHIRFFTPATLGALAQSCGFELLETTGFQGAFLRDLPQLGFRLGILRVSDVYRTLQTRWPQMLALRAVVVARSPQ